MVKLLLEARADHNAINHNGSTPLMNACYNGMSSNVKFLIDRGADVNALNKKGNNAWLFAQHAHNSNAKKREFMHDLLLRAGASEEYGSLR
mmetsp:Transcript_86528/g.279280  ORF Transcript_86528/g.279280 Transcript_86528/m.279280 type:complete len:91 (+) Transcript_86528:363-635(+)